MATSVPETTSRVSLKSLARDQLPGKAASFARVTDKMNVVDQSKALDQRFGIATRFGSCNQHQLSRRIRLHQPLERMQQHRQAFKRCIRRRGGDDLARFARD